MARTFAKMCSPVRARKRVQVVDAFPEMHRKSPSLSHKSSRPVQPVTAVADVSRGKQHHRL